MRRFIVARLVVQVRSSFQAQDSFSDAYPLIQISHVLSFCKAVVLLNALKHNRLIKYGARRKTMPEKGYVQVYTGNGKGKTTAAIGLAVRALGAGCTVCFLQFMKSKVYSEHNIFPHISGRLTVHTCGKPYFIAKEGDLSPDQLAELGDDVVLFAPGSPPADYIELISSGMETARQAVISGLYDLVVLDEIIVAEHFGLVSREELLELIDCKPDNVELVLTGRYASSELIERADLVTEMVEVKHYYNKGVSARPGIDC